MSRDISMVMLVEALLNANSPSKAPRSYYPASSTRQYRRRTSHNYDYDDADAAEFPGMGSDDPYISHMGHQNPFDTIHTRPTSVSSNVTFGCRNGGDGRLISLGPPPVSRHSEPSVSSPETTIRGNSTGSSLGTFHSLDQQIYEGDGDLDGDDVLQIQGAALWTVSSRSMTFATSPESLYQPRPYSCRHPRSSSHHDDNGIKMSTDRHHQLGVNHVVAPPPSPREPRDRRAHTTRPKISGPIALGKPRSSSLDSHQPVPPRPRKFSLPAIFRRRQQPQHPDASDKSKTTNSTPLNPYTSTSSYDPHRGQFRWGFRPVNNPEKISLRKKVWRKFKAMTSSTPRQDDN
ncbi:hypothetical protein FRB95_002241 [Tulasnella sp. JGI-2019a]|nr:hypothetical protein FRB95_002241 [Tulasnella sp. JGI-2019a]